MRVPRTIGAYGVTLVLGLFGASSVMTQCAPTATTTTSAVPTDNCVTLVNKERTSRGLVALAVDSRIASAAQKHSDYQASIGTMTHTGSGGTNAGQRLTNAGYSWSWWAENVAAGQPDCSSVVAAWMASSGHRANILNKYLRNIGIGVTKSSNGALYWTMDFGTAR